MLNKRKQSGFTISESVIAVMLIVVSLVSILTLINRANGFMVVAFNRLAATNLGQEAIEIVRNTRDSNWINGQTWNGGLIGNCGGQEMKIDYLNGLSCIESEEDPYLLFDGNLGYNHNEGQISIYKRIVRITPLSNHELKIEAIVSWNSRNTDFEVVVEDHLYNWY